jgi:hypothetical protein
VACRRSVPAPLPIHSNARCCEVPPLIYLYMVYCSSKLTALR